jgi:hypothetical protein
VFGGFVEHLGRCIYGGLYDEGSALADVLAMLRELPRASPAGGKGFSCANVRAACYGAAGSRPATGEAAG